MSLSREAGCIVLIPFHPPDELQPSTDGSELLLAQKTCGDAVCFVVALGEIFLSPEGRIKLTSLQQFVEKELNEQAEEAGVANHVNARLYKTYSLLLFFTIKASLNIWVKLSSIACFCLSACIHLVENSSIDS